MHKEDKAGYPAFKKWEVELVKNKAKGLIGKYGFTREDIGDLRQKLFLEVYLKRDAGKSWETRTASDKTVMSHILDNKIRNMIQAAMTDKRRVSAAAESLNMEIAQDEAGEVLTYEDLVSEEESLARRGKRPMIEEEELKEGLAFAMSHLTPLQKKVCELIMQDLNISEVARTLGIKRTTLNRELNRMRKVLYSKGLGDFI